MTGVSGEHEPDHARREPQEVRLKPDTTYVTVIQASRFVTRNNTLANGVLVTIGANLGVEPEATEAVEPFCSGPEMKRLPPGAADEGLQAVADAHQCEAPSAGCIRFPSPA